MSPAAMILDGFERGVLTDLAAVKRAADALELAVADGVRSEELTTALTPEVQVERELARGRIHDQAGKAEEALLDWLANERDAAEKASGVTTAADQARMRLLTALPLGALHLDGRRHLAAGDARGAMLHVRAARLTGYQIKDTDPLAMLERDALAALPEVDAEKAAARVEAARREYVAARGRIARIVKAAGVLATTAPGAGEWEATATPMELGRQGYTEADVRSIRTRLTWSQAREIVAPLVP